MNKLLAAMAIALIQTKCYSAETIKAEGQVKAIIVAQEEVTPPAPILVYTEEGLTLQVVF